MSASRERKERAQQPVAQPKAKEKKKMSEGWILAISIIVVIVAVFGTVLGIRYYQRNQTVMTIGDKELKVKEFNYYFNQTASNFGNYASYLGIDTATSIDKQTVSAESTSMMSMLGMDVDCLAPYKQEDGSYDITWAGYFAELAKETAAQTYAVYQTAMDDSGYTVPEEIHTAIDNEVATIELYAQMYSMDTDDFLEANYGDGCDIDGYKEHVTVSYIASDYASNKFYSDAEIDARYAESTEDFDVVSYLVYSVSASDFLSTEEAETSEEETEEDTAAKEEAAAQAKEAAEAMAAEFDLTASDVQAYCDQIRSAAESSTTTEAAEWMFDTAAAGDVKLFENADTNTYYVVKLLTNDVNYECVNLMQIFIPADVEDAESHEGHDHAEGEEVELTAAEKVAAVTSGLEADGSEESFRTLASKHSGNTNVDLEETSYSYISSNISKEAMMWVAEGRQAGDYEVFETSTGTFVLYFLQNSKTYRSLSVNSMLVNEWVEELTATAVANCKFDLDAAMNGAVDLKLSAQQA